MYSSAKVSLGVRLYRLTQCDLSDCPTEAEVRLQLQRDEKQQIIEGRANLAGRSATAFLTAGIQIEDTQCVMMV
jgi:uncharacterized protein VirK/YbjX